MTSKLPPARVPLARNKSSLENTSIHLQSTILSPSILSQATYCYTNKFASKSAPACPPNPSQPFAKAQAMTSQIWQSSTFNMSMSAWPPSHSSPPSESSKANYSTAALQTATAQPSHRPPAHCQHTRLSGPPPASHLAASSRSASAAPDRRCLQRSAPPRNLHQ